MSSHANLYAFFRDHWELENCFIIDEQGKEYSYRDVDQHSALMAGMLNALGLAQGDRVSVQAGKSVDYLCLYFACLRAGYIFHPLNPAYTPSELAYFFADAQPEVLIYDDDNNSGTGAVAVENSILHVFTMRGDGSGTFRNACAGVKPLTRIADVAANEPAVLLYSSGTTGQPKGIPLSHRNIACNAILLSGAWEFSVEDTLLHALPMFHAHGLFISLGCTLMTGSSMIYLSKFDATRVLNELPNATVMMGVPTYYTRLLKQDTLDEQICSAIRLFVSGSAPLRADTFAQFEQRTGHAIVERYGMSETIIQTTNPLHGIRKPGTVGLPLSGVLVRVVDDEANVLPANEIGNIESRSDSTFREYWRKPEKTKEDFTIDGYLKTGDQGFFDEDGYLTIVGREKDLVICGGLNVYPAEIEQVLNEFEGIEECAVIGVAHEDFGEAVVAVVVAQNGRVVDPQHVSRQAREKLANFKAPKHVVIVDALPRNSMGKVQKNVLRATYSNLFS